MINIQDIIPFMKKGWVAMDLNGHWCWYKHKPHLGTVLWMRDKIEHRWCDLSCLDIEPADDWTKSLIEIKR